jgi:uncharacterized membrane protein
VEVVAHIEVGLHISLDVAPEPARVAFGFGDDARFVAVVVQSVRAAGGVRRAVMLLALGHRAQAHTPVRVFVGLRPQITGDAAAKLAHHRRQRLFVVHGQRVERLRALGVVGCSDPHQRAAYRQAN